MGRFLLRRGGQYAIVLALALGINFLLPRLLPGGPLAAIGGGDVFELNDGQRAELLAAYDLDGSLWDQLVGYVADLARGDLGTAFSDGRAVTSHLAEALPWTLLLVGTSIVLTTLIGIAVGAWAGARREHSRDSGTLAAFVSLDALPSFWVGMLLILLFGVTLGWLPTFGAEPTLRTSGLERALGIARHLVLPMTTLVIAGLAQTFLVVRASMLGVLGSDHVALARARGFSRRRVMARHALRPALLPVHTHVLLEIGYLVGGAVVVETVFAYPGVGRMIFDAVLARDYVLMQGGFLVLTVAVVLANALADATYPLLDPRVRRTVPA